MPPLEVNLNTPKPEEKPVIYPCGGGWLSSFPLMKTAFITPIILFILLAAACPKVQAGWFNNNEAEKLLQQELVQSKELLLQQRKATDQWEIIAGTLAVACILLFVIGTAIGAKTRHASSPKPE